MNISFVDSPLMKYAFFASLNEINGIVIPKIEYPLFVCSINIYASESFQAEHFLFCTIINLGLDARNPVFGGLRTTKAQTWTQNSWVRGADKPVHLCRLISAFVIRFLESVIVNLAQEKFQFSC